MTRGSGPALLLTSALIAATLASRVSAQACPAGTAWVSAGRSWVGAPYGECPDEDTMPLRPARVRAMCLDAREVRVRDYEACVASGACPARSALPGCASDDDAAVDCVPWEGARAFCRALGGTLPTEAQLDHGYRSGALEVASGEEGEWTASRGDASGAHLPRRRGRASERVTRSGFAELGGLVDANEVLPQLGFRCRREPDPTPSFTLPECTASSFEHGYACRDFELTTDEIGGAMRTLDPARYRPPRPDVAWGGRRSVLLLSSEVTTQLDLIDVPYGVGPERTVTTTLAAAEREARIGGYDRAVSASFELAPDRWTRVGAFWLRLQTRHHTGDASEHDVGSVLLSCGEPDASPSVELLASMRATRAFVFLDAISPYTVPAFALGVLEVSGGEGAFRTATHYRRVTPADCPVPSD